MRHLHLFSLFWQEFSFSCYIIDTDITPYFCLMLDLNTESKMQLTLTHFKDGKSGYLYKDILYIPWYSWE